MTPVPRRGRTLENLYLQPLRAIVQRCGRVHPDLFAVGRPGGTPPVQVILVGWYPAQGDSMFEAAHSVWRQERITSLSSNGATRPESAVRLVSLDYGKTIGWSGRGPPPEKGSRWLAHLRAVRQRGPGRLTRVHHVPVHPAVYRLLLEGGVDLIGTEHLVAFQGVLRDVTPPPKSRTRGQ